jgi:lipopolysaccharide transport system permease protein
VPETIELDETVIRPARTSVAAELAAMWEFREFLYLLTWRNIKVRYKQTVLGAAWAVLQPLLAMVVFTFVFGTLAGVPSEGVPYPIFVFAGLLAWNYFAATLAAAGNSLVANAHLITKVYFPRMLVPASLSLSGLLDYLIGFAVLLAMMVHYDYLPGTAGVLMLPVLVLLLFLAFQHVIPFLVQMWLFLTPVIYPVGFLPERYRWVLALNPMGGIVEAFRSSILGHQQVVWPHLLISTAVTLAIFTSGFLYFKRVEQSFADVV